MNVLGLSAYYHDAAAALVMDGEIVAAAMEERFSRIKHDSALPVQAVAFCLTEAKLTIDDVDYVVFYEKPLRKFERLLVTHLREFPRGARQFSRSMGTWLSSRLWQKNDLIKSVGCEGKRILFSEHHLSHAASAFLCSPFDRAAIVTADGVGEWATTSVWRGETTSNGTAIEKLMELHFPHSIGLLYSAITAYLGFKVNEGEYKVMGLAPYGTPRYVDQFRELCEIGEDGTLVMNMRYFCYHRHPTRSYTGLLCDLLGPAREYGSPLFVGSGEVPFATPPSSEQLAESQRYADVAASLQKFTEEYMLNLIAHAHTTTKEQNLVMAGGVALNSVANHRIVTEGPFDAMFVQPAAGDAGGALGAALWVTHVVHALPRRSPMRHAFLGARYDDASVAAFLEDCGIKHERCGTAEEMCDKVAQLLADGAVVGWSQGRFEWGPRALGARSILADPRRARMRDRVNQKIKFREAFRPFAPAVLPEDLPRWFVVPEGREEHLTPFMLCVLPATTEGREIIPSVIHADGTARVQRVERAHNELFYDLLVAFKRLTGVGVLLNTSFNLKDEPIVSSPAEAYATFARSDLDHLVLGLHIVSKDGVPTPEESYE